MGWIVVALRVEQTVFLTAVLKDQWKVEWTVVKMVALKDAMKVRR